MKPDSDLESGLSLPWFCRVIGDRPERLGAAATALRRTGILARVERVAARATRDGVRIVDGEATTHQTVDVVDLGAFEVHGAELIDQHSDTVLLDDVIIVFRGFFNRHAIAQSGAAAR